MTYFTDLHSFYTSKIWRDTKRRIKYDRLNENGETVDEVTGETILNDIDMVFHHEIELTLQNVNDFDISLNPDNIKIVSHKTHNEIHKRFGFYRPKVIMVHGNICSGKNTFVRRNAGKDDLIFDMDALWQAISSNDRYVKPNRLKPVVFALRQFLLDQIKIRNGMWFNAWIITTEARALPRQRMIDSLGVDEVIHIDTPVDQCLQNLYSDEARKEVVAEYEGYIKAYAENYQE